MNKQKPRKLALTESEKMIIGSLEVNADESTIKAIWKRVDDLRTWTPLDFFNDERDTVIPRCNAQLKLELFLDGIIFGIEYDLDANL
tara:strand:- start:267 stop:527 length:261 start_codon:yes stop_codon:yes gene_type:complete